MSYIRLQDVSVRFDDYTLYSNLDLVIRRGEKVMISGETGSGVSVLLRLLSGLQEPTGGTIYFEDEPFVYEIDRPYFKQRKGISYFMEELQPIANLSVFDNLALYYRLNTDYKEKVIKEIVSEKLFMSGLESKQLFRPARLTNDERVFLCAVMNYKENSETFIVDEVLYNLKKDMIARIEKTIIQRMIAPQCTVIMRDIDSEAIQFPCKRRIQLSKGTIVKDEVIS